MLEFAGGLVEHARARTHSQSLRLYWASSSAQVVAMQVDPGPTSFKTTALGREVQKCGATERWPSDLPNERPSAFLHLFPAPPSEFRKNVHVQPSVEGET